MLCMRIADQLLISYKHSNRDTVHLFLERATPQFRISKLKSFSCSSFGIRFNLVHPWPSMSLYGVLLPLWCVSILVNYYFSGSLPCKGNFAHDQNMSKCRNWASLTIEVSLLLRKFDSVNDISSEQVKSCFLSVFRYLLACTLLTNQSIST